MPPPQRLKAAAKRAASTGSADFVDRAVERWANEGLALDPRAFSIVERIMRISRAFEREAEALCSEYGLTFWGFNVLAALRNAGTPYQLTPTELYRTGMVTSGGMTKRLIGLESEGLVDRAPAEEDRRSVYVRLTRKGKRLVEAILPDYLALESEIAAEIPRAAQREVAEQLRALLAALEEPV
jgi:DNA-binding MarR family transcriptional regulator